MDASVCMGDNHIGVGIVICDHHRVIIAACSKYIEGNSMIDDANDIGVGALIPEHIISLQAAHLILLRRCTHDVHGKTSTDRISTRAGLKEVKRMPLTKLEFKLFWEIFNLVD
ncbi:hypothetical protein Fot_06731 [Forsythia ovata]|uniref:RNase H type-1 domain-containing protein n=1 Tax=Forsythia ovata TaxID=205694 RepID=A0ABD1WU54_9LAMI